MNGEDLRPITNVGELRARVQDMDDDAPVIVHFGWDPCITESEIDSAGVVVLFVDDEHITTVSRQWLAALWRRGYC